MTHNILEAYQECNSEIWHCPEQGLMRRYFVDEKNYFDEQLDSPSGIGSYLKFVRLYCKVHNLEFPSWHNWSPVD